MSQRSRLLTALQAGSVAATDFSLPNVIDGGEAIFRIAARICELRAEGYEIETRTLPNNIALYRLISEPGDIEPGSRSTRKPASGASVTDPAAELDAHQRRIVPGALSLTTRDQSADSTAPAVGAQLFNPAQLHERIDPYSTIDREETA